MYFFGGLQGLVLDELDSNGSYETQFSNIVNYLEKTGKEYNSCPVKSLIIRYTDDSKKLDISKDQLFTYYKNAIQFLTSKGYNLKDLEIHVYPPDDYIFSKEQLSTLKQLEEYHKKTTGNQKGLYFIGSYEYYEGYSSERVFKANQRSIDIVDSIRNLSPFEQVAYVYHWISDRMYNGVEDRKNSATYVGALTSDKIICVGYAKVFVETLKKMGIQAKELGEASTGKSIDHASCLVYIKDPKYNIDGYYYFDPTWDSRKYYDLDKRLKFFAVAPQKINLIKNWGDSNPFKTNGLDLYKIKSNLGLYFPKIEDQLQAKKLIDEVYSKRIKDEKYEMPQLINSLDEEYGPYFYKNKELQQKIKEKAKEIILKEGKDVNSYDLDAYFHPKTIHYFDKLVEEKRTYDIHYGYFSYATEGKFKAFFEEKFAKKHPNFASTPISEVSIVKANKIAMKKFEEDYQNHWDLPGYEQNEERKISLRDMLSIYKERNVVSRNGGYNYVSKRYMNKTDPWRSYPTK